MPTSIIDVLDSAVKIGIGALISGIATYSVTRLRYRQDAQQNINTRRREIIEKAAENLETFNEFSHECSHSIFGVKKGITKPAELHNAAKGLSKGIGYITKSVANMQLLRESKVVKELNEYKETAIHFCNFVNNCGAKDPSRWDIKDYNALVDLLTEKKNMVQEELSKSYLDIKA